MPDLAGWWRRSPASGWAGSARPSSAGGGPGQGGEAADAFTDATRALTLRGPALLRGEGRFVLAVEGEGHPGWTAGWRTFLEQLEHRPIPAALADRSGAFALALWDAEREELWLARDRLGQRTLFWTEADGEVRFGGSLRSILDSPGFAPAIDRSALAEYLAVGFFRSPATPLHGVHQLPPGQVLRVQRHRRGPAFPFWSAVLVAARGGAPSRRAEAEAALEGALRAALQRALALEGRVGLVLDRGGPAALMAALAVQEAGSALPCFGAEATAAALGLPSLPSPPVLPEHLLQVWRSAPLPSASPRALPALAAVESAQGQLSRLLVAEGGEMLFGGDPGIASFLARGAPSAAALPGRWAAAQRAATAGWVAGVGPPLPPRLEGSEVLEPARRLRLDALAGRLPDDWLRGWDQAARATGLRLSFPLLDGPLLDLALALPASWTDGGGGEGDLVARLTAKHLPPGFRAMPAPTPPLSAWLRGPLAATLEAVLDPTRARERALYDPERVGRAWAAHRAGRSDASAGLLALAAFEVWQQAHLDR